MNTRTTGGVLLTGALLFSLSHATYASTPIKAEVTKATSSSRQTSSEINVGGTWSVERLEVGQQFTVSTVPTESGAPFKWAASFPFALNDGTKIGECTADEATLTCKVTQVPETYVDKTDISGTWWARARLQDAAVGTNEGTITLNGEVARKLIWGDAQGTGTCTNDCTNPVHYEYARPENLKFGWTNDNNTVGWAIKWIVTPGTEYVVKDFDTPLGTSVKCTKSGEWDPATTEIIESTRVDANTIKFTAPADSKVCITYPPEQMRVPEGQSSVTNHAEVNSLKLEATTTLRSSGGTDGSGSNKPNPPVTPEPEPSNPTPEPSVTPNPPSETPKKTEDDPTPSPEKPQENSPKRPAPTSLARTGSDFAPFFIGTGLLAAGLGALAIRRMSGDKK